MTTPNRSARITELQAKVARLKHELAKTEIALRIQRGLDQADRGLGIPLHQADEQLRAKHNIPRT
jgi:hypothetical protein